VQFLEVAGLRASFSDVFFIFDVFLLFNVFFLTLPSFWGDRYKYRFALCCGNVVMSVLSVCITLVYYGQTVGWIRIPLGTEVGLGPGDVVLDRDPDTTRGKGHSSPRLFWFLQDYCRLSYR